jgi:hypothetical protein|tara:strand:+ start:1939 stop:2133 length:195 start_codon:yes stop_codon:yes gene_type:complete
VPVDTTRYDIDFVAPALPNPPQQYNQRDFNQFNNALRLYFSQLDKAVRDASTSPQAQAAGWFFS